MMKRILAGLLAALLLHGFALAEVYEGCTVAAVETPVEAACSGTLELLEAEAGEMVSAGDILAKIGTTKVFASQDGTIARIPNDGETVLELAPMERYRIYCTVEDARQTAETTLVHAGELLYARCKKNGTHRAVGMVTEIDGSQYQLLTLGGELYVGEAVRLYRNAEFSSDQLVGVGTVVGNDTEAYMCEGEVIQMHVQAGEAVQRGELLYDYAAGKKLESSAPADGIVTGILAKPGDSVQENQVLLTLAPLDGILVEIRVDESAAAQLQPGERVELGYADSIEESSTCGTIISISAIAEEELYAVRIRPDEVRPVLGMTVTVRTA